MVRVTVLLMLLILTIVSSGSSSQAAEEGSVTEGEVVLKTLLEGGIMKKEQYDRAVEEIQKKAEDRKEWRIHMDKHITHMKDAAPRLINGFSIAAGITMVSQGSSGNEDNAATEGDVIDGSISADLEISAPLGQNGEAFLLIEAGAGKGLQDDEIVSFWGVNADAGDSGSSLELTEAWYEHRFIHNMFTVTIGKLDITNYFDGNEVANDETTQFLANGFVNNIAMEVPDNSIGARVTLSPAELVDFSVALQSGEGDFENIVKEPFITGGVVIKPQFRGLRGNYRLYGWLNARDHSELGNPSRDDADGMGAGISIDQQVTEGLTLFGRFGYQDENIYEVRIAWSGGVAVSGIHWGRDDDVVGLAYGRAVLSDDQANLLKADGITPADEGNFEAYYNMAVTEHVAATPDIQVLTNAGGDRDFGTVIIGGVRVQITL